MTKPLPVKHTMGEVSPRQPTPCQRRVWLAADILISVFVMFPVLLCYWRGINDVLATFVFPENRRINVLLCTAVGCASPISYLLAPAVGRYLKGKHGTWEYWCVSHVFMWAYGLIFMCLWYGVWNTADYFLGRELLPAVPWLVGCLVVLMVLKCTRSTMWPPVLVIMDSTPDLFAPATRFGSQPEDRCWYVLDSVFTELVLNTLAIMVWRSAWVVMDNLIYPENALMSDIICIAVGVPFALIMLLMQAPMASVSEYLDKRPTRTMKVLWEDFVYLITLFALLLMWRGGWNMNCRYLFPDPVVGGLINHCAGIIGMLMLGVMGLVGSMGCCLDGEDPGGSAIYPIRYVQEVYERPYQPASVGNDPETKGSVWL